MDAAPSPHPTDQTLQSYGLGKLDDASAEAVDEHLEGCPDCRRRVAEMSADSFLGRVRDAEARPRVTARPAGRRRRDADGTSRPERRRHPRRPRRSRRGWPTTPTTRSCASSAAAAWASSTWPTTR